LRFDLRLEFYPPGLKERAEVGPTFWAERVPSGDVEAGAGEIEESE